MADIYPLNILTKGRRAAMKAAEFSRARPARGIWLALFTPGGAGPRWSSGRMKAKNYEAAPGQAPHEIS